MKRRAFTMLELIFVIVIMGIIAKFGIDMLIKAYDNYTFSTVQNRLQQATAMATEEIANRLEYRIKSSVIVRNDTNPNLVTNFKSLSDAANNPNETILEWVGYDDAGFRGKWDSTAGMNMPAWSGFIDLDANHTSSNLISPETNTTRESNIINALSGGTKTINDAAIFFIGGNSDVNGYGWNGTALSDQNETAHPIDSNSTAVDILQSKSIAPNDFTGQSVYEFYKLAWSAYALVYTGDNNTSQDIPYINRLDSGGTNPAMLFDTNGTAGITLLRGGLKSSTQNGGWTKVANNVYAVHIDNAVVKFTYDPTFGTFDCDTSDPTTGNICKRLTK